MQNGKGAFLLGAGSDSQLFGSIYNWTTLVKELFHDYFKETGYDQKNLYNIRAPELLSFLNWTLGNQTLSKHILNKVNYSGKPPLLKIKETKDDYKSIFFSFLRMTNLIVTTNYSTMFDNDFRLYLSKQNPPVELIIIDREDLPSFSFPRVEIQPQNINLIHLHGRCSPASKPIVDCWQYNELLYDEKNYFNFLIKLFSERCVITVGVSWYDPPIINTASFVRRNFSYIPVSHINLPFSTKGRISNSLQRYLSGAMRALYGVTNIPLIYKQQRVFWENQRELLREDYELQMPDEFPDASIGTFASLLDSFGDYEVAHQHNFLFRYLKLSKDENIDAIQKKLVFFANSLISSADNARIEWQSLAKIERHLRHYLYLYRGRNADHEVRNALWLKLYTQRPEGAEWDKINERLKFDFLLGAFETNAKLPGSELCSIPMLVSDPLFSRRLKLANQIWDEITENEQIVGRGKLAEELLRTGWESICAKVLSDILLFMAKQNAKKGDNEYTYSKMVELGMQVEGLSRSVDCISRRVKVDTIMAIWNNNPREARLKLLSILNNVSNVAGIYPINKQSLGLGLMVSYIKALMLQSNNPDILLFDIKKLFVEAGLKEKHLVDFFVESVFWNYWYPLIPLNVKSHIESLKKQISENRDQKKF
jgi:hypothetical protein